MAALIGTFLAFSSLSTLAAQKPIDFVNPLVGSDGHGHTFPGPSVPFGMVQLSPDTRTDTWDGSSGYHYSDKRILGFSHTHLSGTGVGCMGDIMVMPTIGDAATASGFSHKNEVAKPGYYKVFLDGPKVTAELTSTERVGFHKYTFPASDQAHILVDLIHGISNNPREMTLKVVGKDMIVGSRSSNGWGGIRTVYFAMQFSRPFDSITIERNGDKQEGLTEAKGRIRAWTNFKTGDKSVIQVKVAISATGIDGAILNLKSEAPGWSFDQIQRQAEKKWNDALGAIKVESSDLATKRTFYSNAYLCYIAPSLFNDVNGDYLGMDRKVHKGAKFQNYSTFSLWDTYRALHPLLTITQPKRVPDLTSSLVAEYQENGLKTTPIWPLFGNETWCMIGYHSAPVIVDAYFKGLLGPKAETAYQALRDTAMQDHNGLKSYRELGYVASKGGEQASSKTVEYAVDDWCIATMAEALGHKDDAKLFVQRSSNYRNLFDRTSMFIRGRKANGAWRAPFDTLGLVGDEYTEACAWQYAFAAQHDIPGIIDLYGGDQKFSARMDEMFANNAKIHTNIPDITGMIGQYAQGNEQCHHQAYLYNYSGQPWKTQQKIRQIITQFYNDKPDGQVGNNDCGQMSAWYVFSALGFYPVNPANGVYVIGSPAVDKAEVTLPNGKKFRMEAIQNSPKNVYIQSAELNGKPLSTNYITHQQLLVGGTLKFVMGSKPNTKWGVSTQDRPKATMPNGFRYPALPEPATTKAVVLPLPIRIVCGEDDPVGEFVPDPNMADGSTNRANVRIDTSAANAAPARIYTSERYASDFTYRFPVPKDRTYTVRLHFAEIFDEGSGMRIEDISLNGKLVLPNFDIFALAGKNKALVREFKDVKPNADGTITVRIQAARNSPDQNAKISAIEIF